MSATLTAHATHGDPRLSRFDPLSRVIYFDDFDRGMNGWTTLVGNYEDSLDDHDARPTPGTRNRC